MGASVGLLQLCRGFRHPLLYYFVRLPQWRIWAFSNVRNVHELKQRAILGRVFPQEGSFWWRLEIKTAEQKRIIHELTDKFDLPDVFEDDYTIPYETAYSYSKTDRITYVVMTVVSLVVAIVFLPEKEYYTGTIMAVFSIFFGYAAYKRYANNGPLLTISNDGITTKQYGFHTWRDISDEKVFYVSAGKSSHYGLSYNVYDQVISISLRDMVGQNGYKVDHVLRTYRGRYQTTRPSRQTTARF